MKKLLIMLICIIGLTTACGKTTTNSTYNNYKVTSSGKASSNVKTYKSLTYEEYDKKIKNNDTFLLFLWQTGCSHCESFEPKLKSVISNFNLEVYGLNMADLSEDEYAKVKNKTFISGTPTMVYFDEGKNDEKLVGEKSEEELLKFLVKIDYLEEN